MWIKIRIEHMSDHSATHRHLRGLGPAAVDIEFEEHESGPEILTYVTLGAGLATGVIGLVAAIINARAATRKQHALPIQPVELIVRRADERLGLVDEVILRLGQKESDETALEQKLNEAINKIMGHHDKGPKDKTGDAKNG